MAGSLNVMANTISLLHEGRLFSLVRLLTYYLHGRIPVLRWFVERSYVTDSSSLGERERALELKREREREYMEKERERENSNSNERERQRERVYGERETQRERPRVPSALALM